MVRDLTKGTPVKVLTAFALPMFFSMLFQQVYNLVDSIIAGHYLGTNALGAVGACYPVTVIFIAVASGLGLGANIMIANAFGDKNWIHLKRWIPVSVIFLLAVSLAVTALGLGFYTPLLRFLNMPEELLNLGITYLKIYIYGLFFMFLYNISNSIFNALGDSRTPLIFLIFSSSLNILLDYLFVAKFGLGIPGIAWATFISQMLAAVGSCTVLFNTYRKLMAAHAIEYIADLKSDLKFIKDLLWLGIPSVFQQLFISMGQLSLQGVINSYGADTVAGFSAGFKLNTLFVTTTMTLSNALSSYTAQNLGAHQIKRLKDGVKTALKISYVVTAVIVIVYMVFKKTLIQAFISGSVNETALYSGTLFLTIISPFYLVCCAKNTLDGALRGIGAMKSFMAATFADVLVRILLGGFFSKYFGLTGVYFIWPIAWIIGTILSVVFYIYQCKSLKIS